MGKEVLMKILVTGAHGFIGKNLSLFLQQSGCEVLPFDLDTEKPLKELVDECDFVMHLAGVNRPKDNTEFTAGNVDLTSELIQLLKQTGRCIPLLLSSSIQAARENDYGRSKRQAEDLVFAYGRDSGSPVYVYRLDNAFGKWSRPNYNSVVATFCYNIARGLEVKVNDPAAEVPFVYIDDICRCFMDCLHGTGSDQYLSVRPSYTVTVGQLAALIRGFADSRTSLQVPDLQDGFAKKLYSTYLSYLPEDKFSYPLQPHADQRGSFTEFLKTPDRGQVSINISHPGIVKGNHWHHSKNEKFLVVSGEGIIRFRRIGTSKVQEYRVSGSRLEVVDIPTGYTHNIENVGAADMITVMWANEPFDPDHPDTFPEEV
jgi:UDP-2-acetamido-2,6-beta-L-arabino-hexul-4-ose reductase